MSVWRGADEAAFREETEKLKQKREAKEIADRAYRFRQYPRAILDLLGIAFLIMWLWNGLRPQLMPPMDYLQACALLFTLKWLLSQKTGWEPAGFIKKNTEEED